MNIYKAFVEEIKPNFEIEAAIEVWPGLTKTDRFSFKGIDFPTPYTKSGKAIREHLTRVINNVPFLVVKAHEKSSFVNYLSDFYYLPGEEEDLARIVNEGRHLNRELLDLKLVKVYDPTKREIDFSQKSIKVFNEKIDLGTGNFKAEVCMYINDCKQYLRSAIEKKPVNMMKGEFDPTDEEFLIIYGLKELKDMSMQAAGRARLDWRGN